MRPPHNKRLFENPPRSNAGDSFPAIPAAAREIPLPARFKHDMMDRANGMNQAGRRL
ncbi:hypothetical protein CLOSTASPAR_01743 [[Clostridium] asparagiforme DSM 15981]|uniref:Uncharacterized protein n=1 Tax=[Clostridium] asparagiforme DSM 15981 TaxID=518636 RepID=C0CXL8_9FIRM|nr:hypothetical protein CLOSTASPAR_01743 [[Clostridium] asparagiforme DSM 15981]